MLRSSVKKGNDLCQTNMLLAMPDEESEEEREDLFLDTGTRYTTNKARESRKDREEKLRQMMEGEIELDSY